MTFGETIITNKKILSLKKKFIDLVILKKKHNKINRLFSSTLAQVFRRC